MRDYIKKYKRIVIKIGTSSLTHKNGKLNFPKIEEFAKKISDLQKNGKEIILVSSGAIAVGASTENMQKRPGTIEEKQAFAAIGQTGLMRIYEKFFEKNNQKIGQILLTKEDIQIKNRFKNAKSAMCKLIEMEILPIVNENDTISTDEIQFGDNDTLSAYIAKIVNAELLIILSDINGLYTADPRKNPEAKMISEVKEITPEIESLAKGAGSAFGTGGMVTKISAAKICMESNTSMIIASGDNTEEVKNILNGELIGTVFNFNKKHEIWKN